MRLRRMCFHYLPIFSGANSSHQMEGRNDGSKFISRRNHHFEFRAETVT